MSDMPPLEADHHQKLQEAWEVLFGTRSIETGIRVANEWKRDQKRYQFLRTLDGVEVRKLDRIRTFSGFDAEVDRLIDELIKRCPLAL